MWSLMIQSACVGGGRQEFHNGGWPSLFTRDSCGFLPSAVTVKQLSQKDLVPIRRFYPHIRGSDYDCYSDISVGAYTLI
jgi:hypothetical protein